MERIRTADSVALDKILYFMEYVGPLGTVPDGSLADSRSATTLSFHIRSESLKPSFSAAFSVIRIHVHSCQSTGDRLEMWEIWWHGKTFRNRCESSNMTWAA
ncbi:hypothetical protein [Sphingobium yanoikuyae]|uniref:hypothetical protein n=1 Tax=Sphingobium yanoikuyae TaxID=13690 RepID=UPI0035B46C29